MDKLKLQISNLIFNIIPNLIKKIIIYIKNNWVSAIKRLLFQIFFLALVIGVVAPTCIYIYNNSPRKYLSSTINFTINETYSPRDVIDIYDNTIVKWSDVNVIMDTHSHTYYSDGNLSPEDNIRWHILNGYNVMMISDHNSINGGLVGQRIAAQKYADQILVVPGIEWSNCRCHMNLIGINKSVEYIKFPTNEQIKEIIDQVHEMGGFVVLNHYPWSSWANLDQPSIEEWIEMGIDFYEVVNQVYFDYQGMVFCKNNNLKYVTGSDFHYGQRAYGWTVFNIPDLAPGEIPTQQQVISTMLNKKTNISFAFDAVSSQTATVYTSYGSVNKWYTFSAPLIYLGSFFHSYFELQKGMYSFVDGSCTDQVLVIHYNEIGFLVLWVFIVFFAAQLLYAIIMFIHKFIILKLVNYFNCFSRCRKSNNNTDKISKKKNIYNRNSGGSGKVVGEDDEEVISNNYNINSPPPFGLVPNSPQLDNLSESSFSSDDSNIELL